MEATQQTLIKKTLDKFRKNFELIKKIDHYKYIRDRFLGRYISIPQNAIQACYNDFILSHNYIVNIEIKRLESLRCESVLEYQKQVKCIVLLEKSLINLNLEYDKPYATIPDGNILRNDDTLIIADKLSDLKSKYSCIIFPPICDEYISELEEKAFQELIQIQEAIKTSKTQVFDFRKFQNKLHTFISNIENDKDFIKYR